uniref:ATP-cone domain-containing protein n=1 Tax=Aegilops tauschii subsp. strangulata TaxID=200361 RepID=A0A453N8X5_AEGTS
MYAVKRDGRTETVHFDKITVRLKKLSYGLSQEHCDPVLVAQKLCVEGLHQGIHGRHHQPARRARRRDRRRAHRLPA